MAVFCCVILIATGLYYKLFRRNYPASFPKNGLKFSPLTNDISAKTATYPAIKKTQYSK
jgi:hypothetical protein